MGALPTQQGTGARVPRWRRRRARPRHPGQRQPWGVSRRVAAGVRRARL